MYLGQRFTALECVCPDHFQSFRQRNAFQRSTASKRLHFNGCQLTRNFYFRQAGTEFEAFISHLRKALWQGNRCQSGAFIKCVASQILQCARQGDAAQVCTVIESTVSDCFQPLGQHDLCDAAFPKSIITQRGHAVEDLHPAQGRAALKGIFANGGQALRQCDIDEIDAAVKGIGADAGNAPVHHHGGDLLPAGIPGGGVGFVVIRHGAASGNGQRAACQCPGQALAAGAGIAALRRGDILRRRLRGRLGFLGLRYRGFRGLRGRGFRCLRLGGDCRFRGFRFCRLRDGLFRFLRGLGGLRRLRGHGLRPDRLSQLEGHGQRQQQRKQFLHCVSLFLRFLPWGIILLVDCIIVDLPDKSNMLSA